MRAVWRQVDTRLPCSSQAELLAPHCEEHEEGAARLWPALAEKGETAPLQQCFLSFIYVTHI